MASYRCADSAETDPAAQWRVGDQGDAAVGSVAGAQRLLDLGGEVPAVECGGVDGVQQGLDRSRIALKEMYLGSFAEAAVGQ